MNGFTRAAQAREARIRARRRGHRIRLALRRVTAFIVVVVPLALVWLVVTVGLSLILWNMWVES